MISIDIAVRGSKRLEALLEARFGARGRGLHEKLSSVERRVPQELRRSIRWVATIRNKVVHEDGPSPASADDFARTVDQIARGLEAIARSPARRRRTSATTRAPRRSPQRRPGRRRRSGLMRRLLVLIAAGAALAVIALLLAGR